MKKCKECGQVYPDEVEVCTSCNTPLAEETYEVSGAEPRAERPEARKSASGHKATGKMALFFLISLVYFAVITDAVYKTIDRYFVLLLLGGLLMGICLALYLKNAEPGVRKLGVGSCLCGLASVVGVFVGMDVVIVKNTAVKYGVTSVGESIENFWIVMRGWLKEFNGEDWYWVLFCFACEAILCFLIAWLTGRILRKKSNK